jgi:hypothetical protein
MVRLNDKGENVGKLRIDSAALRHFTQTDRYGIIKVRFFIQDG